MLFRLCLVSRNSVLMCNIFYQIGPDQIEASYQYAKFRFECGNYSGAADYLSSTGLFALTLREV